MTISNREAVTAAAAGFFLRVSPLETLLHQRLLPIEHRAVQVDEALRIAHDSHRRAVFGLVVEDLVPRVRRAVVELAHVAESRATAPLRPDTHARLLMTTLLH